MTDVPKTAIELLEASTGLSRDQLIDAAVVATLKEHWVPDGEALSQQPPVAPVTFEEPVIDPQQGPPAEDEPTPPTYVAPPVGVITTPPPDSTPPAPQQTVTV